jgi:hypothetical protein
MRVLMKGISVYIIIYLLSFNGFGQSSNKWMGNTGLTVSYFHINSYSKERPLFFLDQTFEYVVAPKFRIGLGTGINLYPADLTIPIFADFKYLTELNKFGFFVHQSYGYNLKLGNLGFFSHRLIGGFGVNLKLNSRLTIDPELGYVLNLDNFGGGSLSFVASVGLYYPIGKK